MAKIARHGIRTRRDAAAIFAQLTEGRRPLLAMLLAPFLEVPLPERPIGHDTRPDPNDYALRPDRSCASNNAERDLVRRRLFDRWGWW